MLRTNRPWISLRKSILRTKTIDSIANWYRTGLLCLVIVVFSLGLVSCSDRVADNLPGEKKATGPIAEVAPPSVIEQLRPSLEVYQPQVTILSPQRDEVVEDTTVKVKLQVQDLPIFQDEELGLGPHLHLILDNEPYRAVYDTSVYDTSQPLILEDLEPGTHTLRVFASRPWHESFKNEGAYAQTTFHVFTKTQTNNPDLNQPLLTYSRPKGSYGAEPIMLDFYLTNAPLHLVAQEDVQDDVSDWQIRVTINGQSFILDKWQPVYLKGFKQGKNWLEIELLDEQGNLIDNKFNNTARLITYQARGQDTLAKIVRGELTLKEVKGIVDPNYNPAVAEEELAVPEEEIPVAEEELEVPEEEIPVVEEELAVPEQEIPVVEEELAVPEQEIPALEAPTTKTELETAEQTIEEESSLIEDQGIPAEEIPLTEEEKILSPELGVESPFTDSKAQTPEAEMFPPELLESPSVEELTIEETVLEEIEITNPETESPEPAELGDDNSASM